MKQKELFNVLLFFLCLGTTTLLSQSNITASGGDGSGSGGTISYSVGQIDYIEAVGSGGSANLGVQQPYEIFVLGTDEFPNIVVEISTFPNPTTSNITIQLDSQNFEEPNYRLFDLYGRLLDSQSIKQDFTMVSMEHLSTAVYYLHICDKNNSLKSFKIIKK